MNMFNVCLPAYVLVSTNLLPNATPTVPYKQHVVQNNIQMECLYDHKLYTRFHPVILRTFGNQLLHTRCPRYILCSSSSGNANQL